MNKYQMQGKFQDEHDNFKRRQQCPFKMYDTKIMITVMPFGNVWMLQCSSSKKCKKNKQTQQRFNFHMSVRTVPTSPDVLVFLHKQHNRRDPALLPLNFKRWQFRWSTSPLTRTMFSAQSTPPWSTWLAGLLMTPSWKTQVATFQGRIFKMLHDHHCHRENSLQDKIVNV